MRPRTGAESGYGFDHGMSVVERTPPADHDQETT